MLNKSRLESLSDGLFAIVLTILAFNIKVTTDYGITDIGLVEALRDMSPTIVEFFVSFAVLSMFWISHNFLYSYFVHSINRTLVLLNLMYLGFISFIPFSAQILEVYRHIPLAVVVYGINILIIGTLNIIILRYAVVSHEIDNADSLENKRALKLANTRMYLTVAFTLAGLLLASISTHFALLCYAFPIIFNIIPSLISTLEETFGFRIE